MTAILEIHRKIIGLEIRVERWIEEVNNHGVWLFLGTVGCLGVPNRLLQLVSFAMLLTIYVTVVSRFASRWRGLLASGQELANDVEYGSEGWHSLNRIRGDCMSIGRIVTSSWIAMACILFFLFSAAMALKSERPNQSLGSTATAVTIPAAQGVVPAVP